MIKAIQFHNLKKNLQEKLRLLNIKLFQSYMKNFLNLFSLFNQGLVSNLILYQILYWRFH